MALFEIYYNDNIERDLLENLFESVRIVGSAILNEPPKFTTRPSNVEIAPIAAWKLKEKSGIDFIIAITAVEGRSRPEERAADLVNKLNELFPELKFSVFYRYIFESGMMATPREALGDEPLALDEAMRFSKEKSR